MSKSQQLLSMFSGTLPDWALRSGERWQDIWDNANAGLPVASVDTQYFILYILPFTSESYNDKDGCVDNSLGNDNLSITGIFSKRPGVLVPHKVQLWGHTLIKCISNKLDSHLCQAQWTLNDF